MDKPASLEAALGAAALAWLAQHCQPGDMGEDDDDAEDMAEGETEEPDDKD